MEILAEPPESRFDLRFSLAGVPVRVSPWFWIGTLFLSLSKGATLLSVGIWVPAVFLSILVHELGHVWAYKRFGRSAKVCLAGMFGLAISEAGGRPLTARQHIVVSAAGPFAGFLLAGIVIVIVERLGFRVDLLGYQLLDGDPIPTFWVWLLVQDLLAINLVWGLVNLAPVYPLDGSSVFYHGYFRRDLTHGRERSVRTSFLVALALTLAMVVMRSTFAAILFALLAFSSYQILGQMDAPAFAWPRFMGGLKRARERRATAKLRKKIDLQLVENIRRTDITEEEQVSPEVQRTASELLKALNEEIGREMKKRK